MFLFGCWLDYKLCKDRGLVYLSSVMPPKMPFCSSWYEGNQLFTCTIWQHLSSEAPNASHFLRWHLWGRDTVPHPFWYMQNPGVRKSTPYRKTHDPCEQELVYASFLFWSLGEWSQGVFYMAPHRVPRHICPWYNCLIMHPRIGFPFSLLYFCF